MGWGPLARVSNAVLAMGVGRRACPTGLARVGAPDLARVSFLTLHSSRYYANKLVYGKKHCEHFTTMDIWSGY